MGLMLSRLNLLLAKVEASRGMATGAGSANTLIDANQTWLADGVNVGNVLNYKPKTANQEKTKITAINDGANTVSFSPALSGATVDGDIYEIIVEGGLAANEQSFAIAGTADAGSGPTNIIDAALNANDGFAHQGVEVGNQVYITGGGGLGGSSVITALDHVNSDITISPAITGLTTGSNFEIRPVPILIYGEATHNFTIEEHENNPIRTTFTPMASYLGARISTISCGLQLAGGTTWANFSAGTPGAGELPAWTDLLRACGFETTIVASTSVTLNTISEGIPALTMGSYENGRLKKSLGCRGGGDFSFNVGEPGMMNLEFIGIPKEVSSSLIEDVAFPEGIIDPGISAPQYQGITFVPSTLIHTTLSFDLNNTLTPRKSVAAASGNVSVMVTDRGISGSIDPEALKKADLDIYGQWIAGTLVEMNAMFGSVAGNTIQIGSPSGVSSMQKIGISDGDRGGNRLDNINFKMVNTTAENAFAIKIT